MAKAVGAAPRLSEPSRRFYRLLDELRELHDALAIQRLDGKDGTQFGGPLARSLDSASSASGDSSALACWSVPQGSELSGGWLSTEQPTLAAIPERSQGDRLQEARLAGRVRFAGDPQAPTREGSQMLQGPTASSAVAASITTFWRGRSLSGEKSRGMQEPTGTGTSTASMSQAITNNRAGRTHGSRKQALRMLLSKEDLMAEEYRFMKSTNQQHERKIRHMRKATSIGFGSGDFSFLQQTLLHRWADYICSGIVFTNLLVISVETNYMLRDDHSHLVPFAVMYMLLSFLLIGELTLRLVAFGPRWLFEEDRLGCLIDFTCLCGAICEIFATGSLAIWSECMTGCWWMGLIHLTRLLRVFRITRILKFVHPLRILVLQICSALKSVFWALVFLVGVIYIFSLVIAILIVACQLEKNESERQQFSEVLGSGRWRSLWSIMNTLYKSVTGGVDWETPIESLEAIHPGLVYIFVAYISFGVFAVLNVLTGVFCQKAIQSAAEDLDHLMCEHFRSKKNELHVVRDFFEVLDSDMSGTLDVKELARSELDAKVSGYLAFIGLEIDNWQDFLAVLDTDGDGQVDIDEFVAGIMRLRGPAKSLDIARLLSETRHAKNETEVLVDRIEQGWRMITQKLDECCSGPKRHSFHSGGSSSLGPLGALRLREEMADNAPLGRNVVAHEKSCLGEAKGKEMVFKETKRFSAERQVENTDTEALLAEPATFGKASQDKDAQPAGNLGALHADAEVTVDDVSLLGAPPAQNPRGDILTGSSATAVGNNEASKAVGQLVEVWHIAGGSLVPAVPARVGARRAPALGVIQKRGDVLMPAVPTHSGAQTARGDGLAPGQVVNTASGQTSKALSSNKKVALKVKRPKQPGKDKPS